MIDSLAGVVLAAGAGTRLQPITRVVPKPLCPVANRTLVDHALDRLRAECTALAVNVHHHADAIAAAVPADVHVSHEVHEALGTAGAIGALRGWLDGRAVVVVNGDMFCPGGIDTLLEGWDGGSVRLLVPSGATFGPSVAVLGCALPAGVAAGLDPRPSGLYESVWRGWAEAGRLELVGHGGMFTDCGTPARLLAANLRVVGETSVVAPSAVVSGSVHGSAVGEGSVVAGEVVSSVLFPGATVAAGEQLVHAIRVPATPSQLTVLVR